MNWAVPDEVADWLENVVPSRSQLSESWSGWSWASLTLAENVRASPAEWVVPFAGLEIDTEGGVPTV